MTKLTKAYEKWWLFSAIAISTFLGNTDLTAMNLALTSIGHEFNLTLAAMQWLINAHTLTYASLIIIGGRIADGFGRLRMFAIGISLIMLASLLGGFSHNITELILSRILLGIGAAIGISQTATITYSIFPEHQRNLALGLLSAIIGLGMAAGPLIGGLLIQFAGWRWIFFINIPLSLIAVIIALFFSKKLQEKIKAYKPRNFDYWGMIILTISLFSLSFSITQAKQFGWFSTITILLLSSVLIMLIIFYQIEKRHPHPIIHPEILRNKLAMLSSIVRMLLIYLFHVPLFVVSLYMQNILGYSAYAAGNIFLSMTLMIGILSPFGGILISKYGAKFCLLTATLLFIPTYYFLAQLNINTPLWRLSSLLALIGIAYGIFTPAILRTVMDSVTDTKLGVTSSIFYMASLIGSALGIAVAGSILDEQGSDRLVELASNHGIILTAIQSDHVMQALFDDDFLTRSGTTITPSLLTKLGHLPQQAFMSAFSHIMLLGMLLAIICSIIIYFNFKKTTVLTTETESH